MLKEIIRAFRHKDVIKELAAQVGDMLDAGAWMFEQAGTALAHEVDWNAICDPLYERDRQINGIEQSIREKIVTHLSVGNQGDMAPCLVLMNVVKDAERIGDYCKNIFEVGRFYQHEYTHPEYARTLDDIRTQTVPLFADARKAFVAADARLAKRIMDIASKLRARCDVVIRQLLSVHDQIAPDEAVAYVLLARFYKRVAAHLANIATSVVSPVPMLDYRGKMPDAE